MKYRRMDYLDRIKLAEGIEQGRSQKWMARRLKFHSSTISRELARNRLTVRSKYDCGVAQRSTWKRWGWRRQPRKLCGEVRDLVERLLQQQFSPEQICCRLRHERSFHLAPETIYRMVERDRRSSSSRELWRHLRQARKARRRRCLIWNRTGKRQHLPSVKHRPKSANERRERGHWERDTMLGTMKSCALLVMVDRKTRYTKIRFLPNRTTEVTTSATMELIRELPCKTITSDRGNEFIDYESLQYATNAKIYFCTPYTASERGTNENTIGLLRQYFPKGKDVSGVTTQEIQHAEDRLNHRPRKCLDWKTPYEVFFRKTSALCA